MSRTASSTRACTSGRTFFPPASVRETVIGLTPASAATSLTVGCVAAPFSVVVVMLAPRAIGRAELADRPSGRGRSGAVAAASRNARVRLPTIPATWSRRDRYQIVSGDLDTP